MTMMNIKSCISRGIFVTVLAAASLLLTGCVDQHPEGTKTTAQTETVESMLEITDPVEKQAVEVAKCQGTIHGRDPEDRSYFSGQLRISVTNWNWIWLGYAPAAFPPFRSVIKL